MLEGLRLSPAPATASLRFVILVKQCVAVTSKKVLLKPCVHILDGNHDDDDDAAAIATITNVRTHNKPVAFIPGARLTKPLISLRPQQHSHDVVAKKGSFSGRPRKAK